VKARPTSSSSRAPARTGLAAEPSTEPHTFFNSNYYFNNINGQPRDRINLNQFGGHVGGPILKNKLSSSRISRLTGLPNTYNFTRQVLTPDALNGLFTYKGTDGTVRSIDLYKIATQSNASLASSIRPFATTPIPSFSSTLNQIQKLVSTGNLKPRTATKQRLQPVRLQLSAA